MVIGNSNASVSEILARYGTERVPLLRRRTQTDYRRHITILQRDLGPKIAAQLTLGDLAEFMNVPKGKIQRNRQLAVLSAAFTEAIRWGWLHSNVCKEVTRHKAKRKERQLSDEEYKSAWDAAAPRVRAVMDLALLTGQLQSQILSLRWAQVHDDVILFRHHKTNKKLSVRITPAVAAALQRCRQLGKDRAEYVINTRKGQPYTSEGFRACWQRTMQRWARTGNDPFTFHDVHAKWARDFPAPPNGQPIPAQTLQSEGQITATPRVFSVPNRAAARDAAAVMMPLDREFDRVYETIRDACAETGFQCQRADDIWEESTIIQDIFNLIHRSHVVIVDFSTRNGNVLYETGIAHTLGKHVVPIARNIDDVPFDIKHHRILKYSDESDAGLAQLRQSLAARLRFIGD